MPRTQPYSHKPTSRRGSVASRPAIPSRARIGSQKPLTSSFSTNAITVRTGCSALTRYRHTALPSPADDVPACADEPHLSDLLRSRCRPYLFLLPQPANNTIYPTKRTKKVTTSERSRPVPACRGRDIQLYSTPKQRSSASGTFAMQVVFFGPSRTFRWAAGDRASASLVFLGSLL